MQYTTDDLLTSIKTRSLVPISQQTYQDSDLVQLSNEELQLKLVSDILGERENFFLTNQSTPMIAGVSIYTMPSRAIGNSLKIVWFVGSDGAMTKLSLKDVDSLPTAITPGPTPDSYFIQGDQVVIMPTPTVSSGSIRMDFFARPNKLVLASACSKITGQSTTLGTTTYTVDTDLTATLSVGSLVDVISMTSPFILWGYKVSVTAITTTTIAVSSTNVSDAAGNLLPISGDYIALTGTSPIAQVPQEFHPVLAQMVANRLILGLGDMQKYQFGMKTLAEDRMNALKLIRNRVELSPQYVTNRTGIFSAFTRRL